MNTTGTVTVSRIEKEFNSNALHHAFTVGTAAVKIGQPVKLHTDGTVIALAPGDLLRLCIGHCIQDKGIGEEVTIAMRARAIVHALSSAALNPGPVKFASIDATTGKTKYATTATVNEEHGYSLTIAGAADVAILVAVL